MVLTFVILMQFFFRYQFKFFKLCFSPDIEEDGVARGKSFTVAIVKTKIVVVIHTL